MLHADPDAPPPPWLAHLNAGVLALVALLLGWLVLRVHVVGDYAAESDFYGGYVTGARLFQRGMPDPSRYGIMGPLYDALLAVAGAVLRDLFLAAKAISALSALAVLVAWRRIARATLGPVAASWLVVLLAANPVFLRFACAATTDMLAMALQAGCIAALVTGAGGAAMRNAGALAALAFLTRYSSAYLLPVAGVLVFRRRGEAANGRGRALAEFLGWFAAVVAPWFAYSLWSGFVPGSLLFRYFDFYVTPGLSRNVQDVLGVPGGPLPPPRTSFVEFLRHDPSAIFRRLAAGVPEHLWLDAKLLLGLPAATLCAAGLALSLPRGAWRRLAPIALPGAALFLALAPVFHSERYSLPLAPAYLALAAVAAASPWLALPLAGAGLDFKTLAAAAVVLLTAKTGAAALQRQFASDPAEVVAAGRALAKLAAPGDRVISRKGHIGYYSGLDVVTFPRVGSTAELGEAARAEHARFLYYSWYEAKLRPELALLLDTTAAVPGLDRVWVSHGLPAVLYRIGPEFGLGAVDPAEAQMRAVRQARALVAVLRDSTAAPYHAMLAADALDRGQFAAAIAHAGEAIRWQPRLAAGWLLMGDAQFAAGHLDDAGLAYGNALARDPLEPRARFGLGRVQLQQGRRAEAARTWRPLAGSVGDPATAKVMAELFDSVGDRQAAAAARAAAKSLPAGPSAK
jgi:tetratricopeptide (TPR) repeat protein